MMVRQLLGCSLWILAIASACPGAIAQSTGRAPNTGDPALMKPSPYSLRLQDGAVQPASPSSDNGTTSNNPAAGLPPASAPMQPLPTPPSGASFRRSAATNDLSNNNGSPIQNRSLEGNAGSLNPSQTMTARPSSTEASIPVSSEVQPASFTSTPTNRTNNTLQGMELRAPSKEGQGTLTKPSSSMGTLVSMMCSLVIVLGLFLGAAWFFKKTQPKGFHRLPNEVVQVLGRTNLAPRQQIFVVRFGKKLLLVSQQAGHTQTLSEIDENSEVERLAGVCEASQPSSITQTFSDVLRSVATGKEKIPSMPRKLRNAS